MSPKAGWRALLANWVGVALVFGAARYVVLLARRARVVKWREPTGRPRLALLSVRLVGQSGPPVLLLHGLAASSRYWGAAYDELGGHPRLIAADLPGFGESPWPGGVSGPELVDVVADCLDRLGLSEPCVVVGHSLGCIVALGLAARHPRRVRAVVGFGPPLYPGPAEARSRLGRLGALERLFVLDAFWARAICR